MKSTKTCPRACLSSRAAPESGASITRVWNSGRVRLKVIQTSISSWMASVKLKAPSALIARSASAIPARTSRRAHWRRLSYWRRTDRGWPETRLLPPQSRLWWSRPANSESYKHKSGTKRAFGNGWGTRIFSSCTFVWENPTSALKGKRLVSDAGMSSPIAVQQYSTGWHPRVHSDSSGRRCLASAARFPPNHSAIDDA